MDKKDKKIYVIKFIFVICAVSYIFLGNNSKIEKLRLKKQNVQVINHWRFQSENAKEKLIHTPSKQRVRKNTKLILRKNVTKNMVKEEDDGIAFYTICQKIKVKVNGKTIFERRKSKNRFMGRAAPSSWNIIRLKHCKVGDELTITLSSPYTMTSGDVPTFYTGKDIYLMRLANTKGLQFFFLDSILLFLGIFWIAHYFYMRESVIFHEGGLALGLLAIVISGWFYFGSNYRPNMWVSDAVSCFLGEMFFILIPVVYAMVLENATYGKFRTVNHGFVQIAALNFIVCILLHLTGICDMMSSMFTTHILILSLFGSAFVYYGRRIEQGVFRWTSTKTLGGILLMIGALVELYHSYFLTLSQIGVAIRVGVIAYVFSIELEMMKEEKNAEQLFLKNENKMKEMQLKMLSSQIQPHFIYNTLGSIQGLIQINPKEASELTYMFSKYLRENVDFLDSPIEISMEKELNHVYNYVNIEKVRFGERVKVSYDIGDMDFNVPALALQPLVENAIKHGICKKDEGGTVKVSVRTHGDLVRIIIADDGVGFDAKEALKITSPSVGLRNSIYRWETYNHAKVQVDSKIGEGTVVTIIFYKRV